MWKVNHVGRLNMNIEDAMRTVGGRKKCKWKDSGKKCKWKDSGRKLSTSANVSP